MSGIWHAELRDLGATLRDEAIAHPHRWAWRALPRGAVVSCRVHPQYQCLQFRIARPVKPVGAQRGRWTQELAIFESHLDLAGWSRTEADTETGGVEALYMSPEPLLPLGTAPHEVAVEGGTP